MQRNRAATQPWGGAASENMATRASKIHAKEEALPAALLRSSAILSIMSILAVSVLGSYLFLASPSSALRRTGESAFGRLRGVLKIHMHLSEPSRGSSRLGSFTPSRKSAMPQSREETAVAPTEEDAMAWVPQPDKYLLAYCVRGQSSNRNLCLRNQFFLAGLLNRTLLIPFNPKEQHERHYDLHLRWDLNRTRRCLGEAAVMTTEEFRQHWLEKNGASVKPPSIRVQCWQGPPEACGVQANPGSGQPSTKDINCPAVMEHRIQLQVALTTGKPQRAPGGAGNVQISGRGGNGTAEPGLDDVVRMLRLDTGSHLHALLSPFPASLSLPRRLQRGSHLGNSPTTAPNRTGLNIGLSGLLTWGASEDSLKNEQGPEAVPVGASCLEKKTPLSLAATALSKFTEDILVVGDLVEGEIQHPFVRLAGWEHVFKTNAGAAQVRRGTGSLGTSPLLAAARREKVEGTGEQCSWTVLVPQEPILHLAGQIAAVIRASPYPQCQAKGDCPAAMRLVATSPSALPVEVLRGFLDSGPTSGDSSATESRSGESLAEGNGAAEDSNSGKFLSLHWRRGDFIQYCFFAVKSDQCTYAPRQAANCTARRAMELGLRRIFVATNTGEEEVESFRKAIKEESGGSLTVFTISDRITMSPQLRALLEALGSEKGPQQVNLVRVILEKLVAAQGTAFLGSVESTFTKDIIEMRRRLGTRNPKWDSFLCLGQKEWDNDPGKPQWMHVERKLRRWKDKFLNGTDGGGNGGMSGRISLAERLRRQKIIEVFDWLQWRAWKRTGPTFPQWYIRNKEWKEWRQGYAREKGLALEEAKEREWVLRTIDKLEEGIKQEGAMAHSNG